MRKGIYIALAAIAGVIVYFTNDAISAFLRTRSVAGAGILFIALPLAALLTRPVVVLMQRGREGRAIGVVYALRARRFRFIFGSIVRWLVMTIVILALVILLHHEGEIASAAAVANWWYVVSLLVLIAHLIPSRFQLAAAPPVTVIVLGGPSSGKSTFIGLLPIEPTSGEWKFNASPSTALLTAQLHARARGAGELQPVSQIPRSTLVRRRAWSLYAGVRPVPVDFVELREFRASEMSGERTAFALLLPSTAVGDDGIRHELKRHLQNLRAAGLASGGGKIQHPVAVLLSKADLSSIPAGGADNALPQAVVELLDRSCRKWNVFAVSDRAGTVATRTGPAGFAPKGYVDAALWLVTNVA